MKNILWWHISTLFFCAVFLTAASVEKNAEESSPVAPKELSKLQAEMQKLVEDIAEKEKSFQAFKKAHLVEIEKLQDSLTTEKLSNEKLKKEAGSVEAIKDELNKINSEKQKIDKMAKSMEENYNKCADQVTSLNKKIAEKEYHTSTNILKKVEALETLNRELKEKMDNSQILNINSEIILSHLFDKSMEVANYSYSRALSMLSSVYSKGQAIYTKHGEKIAAKVSQKYRKLAEDGMSFYDKQYKGYIDNLISKADKLTSPYMSNLKPQVEKGIALAKNMSTRWATLVWKRFKSYREALVRYVSRQATLAPHARIIVDFGIGILLSPFIVLLLSFMISTISLMYRLTCYIVGMLCCCFCCGLCSRKRKSILTSNRKTAKGKNVRRKKKTD